MMVLPRLVIQALRMEVIIDPEEEGECIGLSLLQLIA
jgi:hypothetical protein